MGKRMKSTESKPWHYTDSGLDTVWLVGIEIERDAASGEEEPIIPHLRDLHDCIFLSLLERRGRLSGPEARYLRRHIGWTQEEAAKALGFNSPQYFSELERRKVAFRDIPVDFVWRLLCIDVFDNKAKGLRRKHAKDLKERLLHTLPALLSMIGHRPPRNVLKIRHTRLRKLEIWYPIPKAA